MISILYVDDESLFLTIAGEYLASFNFTVHTTASAREALEMLERTRYDAIVSDFNMPDMNGIAFVREVRKRHGEIPFILFTGKDRNEGIIEAIENGVDYYVQKGGRPTPQFTELTHKIHKAIELREKTRDLRERESRFRSLIHNSSDIIRILNPEGAIIFDSPSSSRILGYPPGTCLGKNILEYIHPEDVTTVRDDLAALSASTGEVPPIEFRIRKEDGTYLYVESTGLNRVGVAGIDGIVSTIHPIHARKMAELRLKESEARLELALEGAGEGLWDWHLFTGKAYFNPGYYTMLGYEPGEFPATYESWVSLLHPDEKDAVITDLLHQVRERRTRFESEYRIRKKDGTWCWILGRGKPIEWDEQGEITRLIGTNADISGHKIAELTIKEYCHKLARAQRVAHIGCWEVYLPSKSLQWSEEIYRIMGFHPGTPVTYSDLASRFPPDELERFRRAVNAAIHNKEPYCQDFRIIIPDGTTRYIHDEGEVTYDEEGNPTWMIGTTQDITAIKRDDLEILEKEKKYHSIFDNAVIGICQVSAEGQILSANRKVARILGYNSEEDLIRSITNSNTGLCQNPDDSEKLTRILSEEGILEDVEIPCFHKDGHRIWLLLNGRVIRSEDGSRVYYEGAVQDITARRLAEDNLTFQSKILETMAEGIIVIRVRDRSIIYTNPTFDTLFGYEDNELIGQDVSRIIAPDEKRSPEERTREIENLLIKNGIWSGNIRNIKADGTKFWCYANTSTYEHPEYGTVWIAAHTDITERKRSEDLLLLSHKTLSRQKTDLATINEIITTVNRAQKPDELFREILDCSLRLLDFDGGGIYLINHVEKTAEIAFYQNLPTEFVSEVRKVSLDDERYSSVLVDGLPLISRYYENVSPENFQNYGFRTIVSIPLFSGDKIIGSLNLVSSRRYKIPRQEREILISIGRELGSTIERITAEKRVRDQEKKYRELAESIRDVYLAMDKNLVYTYWNKASEILTGIPEKDAIGRHYYDLFPWKKGSVADKKYREILRTQEPITFEDSSIFNGKHYYLEISGYPTEEGISVFIKDINERKRSEETLKQLNHKLNLLSGITRHDILNEINTLQILFELIRMKIDTGPVVKEFEGLDSILDVIQSQIQFTKVYQDLGVYEPAWQDLNTVLSYIEKTENIELFTDIDDVEIFADPLFCKVFTNLMDNTKRHGVDATTVHVSTVISPDTLTIIWEDDGSGIPESNKELIFDPGFGKNTGFGLFFIRSILSLTAITIRECGVEGEGARFEMVVPENEWRPHQKTGKKKKK